MLILNCLFILPEDRTIRPNITSSLLIFNMFLSFYFNFYLNIGQNNIGTVTYISFLKKNIPTHKFQKQGQNTNT